MPSPRLFFVGYVAVLVKTTATSGTKESSTQSIVLKLLSNYFQLASTAEMSVAIGPPSRDLSRDWVEV